MAAPKPLGLLALAFLAIVALFSAPAQVNALVADRAQVARHAHAAVAKHKRTDSSSSSLCKPRPSSSPAPSPPSTSNPAPTPTTPSPTSSSAAPSTTSGSSGSKKWGLAWAADSQYLSQFSSFPGVGYIYTWNPDGPSNSDGLTFCPMLWGWDQVSTFQQTVVQGYATCALGVNEPNEPSQSNMSPTDAASLWMQALQPLKAEGYYLVSPACTDDQSGLDWYQQFFAACSGCTIDAIAFHAYTTNATDLINYATELRNEYGLPIWITEFADQNFSGTGGQPSSSDVQTFAAQVKQFVEATDWIGAAFPFGAMMDLQGVDTANALMNPDGSPTALASFYFS